ncbi:MAG: ABC transporter ATP-binding protein [Candidatus Pacebacteria bacterium]|nr:ABC transporter ATP-binding protein [Candidatus Paceibacterota bacterium]
MKVSFSRIFHYLWPHIKKHWLSFSLMLFAYAVGAVFDNILKPLVFKSIIDLFSSGLARYIILNKVMYLFVVVSAIVVVQIAGYRAGDYAVSFFESKIMKELYDFTFERLLEHSYRFFSNNFSGSLIAKSRRFSKQFETLADIISFQIWFSFVILLGILIVLFIKIPILAWIFLGWSMLYVFMTVLFVRRKMLYDATEAAADSLVTGRFADVVSNILNVKIFSSDEKEEKNFESITTDEEIKRRRAWYFGNLQNLLQGVMIAVLQIFVLFLDIHFWYMGKISIGMFVLIQSYMFSLFDILWNLGRSFTRAMKAMTDMQEVVDIFDTPIDILDPKEPEISKMSEGNILFQNVSFDYKNGVSVLKNFNLKINSGERIGLVGYSGAGKTTITKLLLRFSDITNGSILIDGQDIKNVTQNTLRSVISYVPQESILFHRTIRENISYSKPNATKAEIFEVAKKAHADEFISKLPQGYDTLVGERGIKLSGGERQRVAIARAMLKDSPILMLDEATSSLDSISEHYIQDAFTELMKGKTTIVIAHRLSTIQKMDRIVVLDKGIIVEEGNHKELLEKKGMYASLWNHQTGGFLE